MEINDESLHEGFNLYQMSVSGHNSSDEFCAVQVFAVPRLIRSSKQINLTLTKKFLPEFQIFLLSRCSMTI
jgi:hypothetical protein